MTEKAKGISVKNTIRHIKKHGAPEVKIKNPMKYLNKWRSKK
jgi:hypothetical protein